MSNTDHFVPVSKQADDELTARYLRLHGKAKRNGADPGRNLVLKGQPVGRGDVRAPLRKEVERSVKVLKRMTATSSAGGGASAPSGQLQAIAACESGGDPTAVGGGGLYRGKYQFNTGTWASVGGSGDPAAAPEAEQDKRAAMLLARDGAGHWPNCGQ